jgi:hypothetical protein
METLVQQLHLDRFSKGQTKSIQQKLARVSSHGGVVKKPKPCQVSGEIFRGYSSKRVEPVLDAAVERIDVLDVVLAELVRASWYFDAIKYSSISQPLCRR